MTPTEHEGEQARRASAGAFGGDAEGAECVGDPVHPGPGHPAGDPPDVGVGGVGRDRWLESDDVVVKGILDEEYESVAGIGDLTGSLDQLDGAVSLPFFEGGHDKSLAVGEVPVEAAPRRVELAGQYVDLDRAEATDGQGVEGGANPARLRQSCGHPPNHTDALDHTVMYGALMKKRSLSALRSWSVGPMLLGLGVVHLACTPVFYGGQLKALIDDGVVNAGDAHADVAWYLVAGAGVTLLGGVVDQIERDGRALPDWFGWSVLAVGACGAVLMPAGGFWLYLGVGAHTLLRARRIRSAMNAAK